MPTHYDSLPDAAFGHHPHYGIVAANPKQLASSEWVLKRLDFHPVPDQPTLYALTDQQRDGQGRTTRAVALLRQAGLPGRRGRRVRPLPGGQHVPHP